MGCGGSNNTNLKTVMQKILQYINICFKNSSKMYHDELISKSKNKIKTTWKITKK